MLEGDRGALARLITILESGRPLDEESQERIAAARGRAYTLGLTGPPGAGKSTVLNRLIALLREKGKKIGVIAIDPSSPFTGGAVLGDRVRMLSHSTDDGVFIRSLGTRGALGGLSRPTEDILALYDAFGMDYSIIETVGVGQTELDVIELADTIAVVLVPESGDSVQVMKAGLLEIGDIFVINKADRGGAERLGKEIELSLHLVGGEGSKGGDEISRGRTAIITDALQGKGIRELMEAIELIRDSRVKRRGASKRGALKRGASTAVKSAQSRLEKELIHGLGKITLESLLRSSGNRKAVSEVLRRVRAGELSPEEGAGILAGMLEIEEA